jgi:hypothetical protein
MFTLKFTTGNSAFEGSPTRELEEVIRILERIPEELGAGARDGTIRDTNGNAIGMWNLTN